MGDTSEHWRIAMLAVATGIAPHLLLQESDRMLMNLWFAAQQFHSAGNQ